MTLLELFAGSRSIGKVAEKKGINVFSTDIEAFENIDLVKDILQIEYSDLPLHVDAIWCSPPCTAFSVAAIGKNWKYEDGKHYPKNDNARLGLLLVQKTIEILAHYAKLNPDLVWYMENPRGILRKMDITQELPIRHTVTYCQYGDSRMKPTDIWTDDVHWKPKPACKNGDTCHVAAPRGSRTGTQGLKGAYERSKIPEALCIEIVNSMLTTNLI